ncbi:DUF3224 domain-containing protein [Vogesella sp. LIG4]|uniref:DUF3224 domain-containing protein n=1 Tax=Vogesella sp. LIG4 TaxID=1192162 RepID=UPI00081FB951|nr:DUF3224 domain-containing protein [Vogesella sp. LIG4]SCK12587.1 Protein of unknown function [Vogesella sp. LIG4]
MQAIGTFNVKLTPLVIFHQGTDAMQLGRLAIEKEFSGDLSGSSRGEMLSAITPTPGSAGYVAIEQVQGSLAGRQGSFLLQHNGVMTRGEKSLTLTVVPDSASGELAGLSGTMAIDIVDGLHHYRFDYQL